MDILETEILVLGAGPGGYAAAFYASDKGKKVLCVEERDRPGGVCLHCGCIPSKTLLQAVKLMREVKEAGARGISCPQAKWDLEKLRVWKDSVIDQLSRGICGLAKRRGVEILKGRGCFEDSHTLRVENPEGPTKRIRFQKAILATGSKPALPKMFDIGDPRVMTSTEALALEEIPDHLLVVGGGYIGMELGTVYAGLGSRVVLTEALDGILSGADADLVRPVMKYAGENFAELRLGAKVLKMENQNNQIKVTSEIGGDVREESYDRVLVSVGRVPNSQGLGLEKTSVELDEKGFVKVNARQETGDPSIFAVGDIAGGALLAHKAVKEARIAVEVILGERPDITEEAVIPAVVFTDPEVAWCGLTETDAQSKGIPVQIVRFPWSASGRAVTAGRTDGSTKLIVDPVSQRVLGVGIAGHGASELIGEGIMALKTKALVRDFAEAVHPHPTLSETLMECAEMFFGHATNVYNRPRGK